MQCIKWHLTFFDSENMFTLDISLNKYLKKYCLQCIFKYAYSIETTQIISYQEDPQDGAVLHERCMLKLNYIYRICYIISAPLYSKAVLAGNIK